METSLLFPSTPTVMTIFALLTLFDGLAAAADQITQNKLATSNNEFSLEIYRKVCAVAVGSNVFLSPTSILIGLGMIRAGARGETKSQLTKSMHLGRFNDDDRAINEDFRGLISTLNSAKNNYTLRTANRMFAGVGFQLREEFMKTTDEYFQASLKALKFFDDPDGSRRTINDWVSEKTEGKINDLLQEDSIQSDTVLVLVNAIYFKGLWIKTFQKNMTKLEPFNLSLEKKTTVEMMTRSDTDFNYYNSEELGCQVLELPYAEKEVSMLVLLPHDIEGLSSVESRLLGSESLGQIFSSLERTIVDVSLPKFVFDQGVSLKQFLEQLGIVDMFGRRADLSGIDGSNRLYVTEAVHKAFIAVDEEGTEAAASTGYFITFKSARPKQPPAIKFVADRPFLFCIVERTTGSVLFIGRLVSPSLSGSGDIGVFGKTAEQRCCVSDGSSASSIYAGVFLGLCFPIITSIVLKLL